MLDYAPSPGIPELIDAIKSYYDKLDMHFDKSEIYITTGGSEALAASRSSASSTTATRSSSPSRSTPTTTPWCAPAARPSRPIPTCPEEGYHYAEREKIEPLINEHTRAIMVTNPGNPTGVVLTRRRDEDAR